MRSEVLICPTCKLDVNNHTELESATCDNMEETLPTQHNTQTHTIESTGCNKCQEEENAIRRLWAFIPGQPEHANLIWRCSNCNQERQLSIALDKVTI